MHITEEFCQKLSQIDYPVINNELIDVIKQLVLDGLSVAVAAINDSATQRLIKFYQKTHCIGSASIIGATYKTVPTLAAGINAFMMHVLDYEAMWSPPTHPTSCVLPVVLALAEQLEVNGSDLIVALAKGFELQGKILYATDQYNPGKYLFHPPGFVGILGATMAASHLLKSPINITQHALGIAASRASGLMANVGTMTKAFHSFNAASSGLEAALLAQEGFTANTDILGAPNGYISAFWPHNFQSDLLLDFEKKMRLLDPGLYIKIFPSHFATQYAIGAGLALHEKIKNYELIKKITIFAPKFPYVDRPYPTTGREGKFSFQYTALIAMLDGYIDLSSFDDARLAKKDIQTLLAKTELKEVKEIPPNFRKMYINMKIDMKNGEEIYSECHDSEGIKTGSLYDSKAHLNKVKNCLAAHLSSLEINNLLELLENFENLNFSEVRKIMNILSI